MRSHQAPRLFCAFLLTGVGFSVSLAGAQPLPSEIIAATPPVMTEMAPPPVPVIVDPVLPPEADAFRRAIRAEIVDMSDAERAAFEQFYGDRGFAPYWTAPGTQSVSQLIAALNTAPAQGMPIRRYDPGALSAVFAAPPGETTPALREVAAARTYLRYAADLSAGILKPSRVDPEIAVEPERLSAPVLLAKLSSAPVERILTDLRPQGPAYPALMAEKARLEKLIESNAWGPGVAEGPTLHLGETDPRIGALRARLARQGYGAPTGTMAGDTFDASLMTSVEGFQRDHGLNPDGAVGQHTLSEINTSPEQRLTQVLVNLERARWLNRDFGPRYILVNIPDYRVRVFEDNALVWQTKAVVGEAKKTRTTEFSDVMSYIVINPSWNVPSSIAKRVYLPKLKRDPGALANSDMQLMTPSGTVINPRLVDFNALGDSFPFRIRQNPSDSNSLGKVKFIFPNDHAIYLHDTPHRELFAKDARAFSNGCIRLQDPDGLADLLLGDQITDAAAAFDGWVASKAEKTVTLKRPIPVHLVYNTVFLDDAGVPRYRDDVYGRDAEVFRALEKTGVTLPVAQG